VTTSSSSSAEAPPHRSFSQLKTFQTCAHQYYLSKIMKVPEVPAVYLTAGSAIHAMIEKVNHVIFQEGLQGVRSE
jgi:ATP-dependent helicase/DNAse subunit B